MNILELIDGFLPQDILPISFLSLPQNGIGMLIEETGTRGVISSFNGYDGVISSTIQFYVRVEPTSGRYKEIDKILKQFYKLVQSGVGVEKEQIKLLYVGEFNLVNMRDGKNNYIFSMTFPVIYKEME